MPLGTPEAVRVEYRLLVAIHYSLTLAAQIQILQPWKDPVFYIGFLLLKFSEVYFVCPSQMGSTVYMHALFTIISLPLCLPLGALSVPPRAYSDLATQ